MWLKDGWRIQWFSAASSHRRHKILEFWLCMDKVLPSYHHRLMCFGPRAVMPEMHSLLWSSIWKYILRKLNLIQGPFASAAPFLVFGRASVPACGWGGERADFLSGPLKRTLWFATIFLLVPSICSSQEGMWTAPECECKDIWHKGIPVSKSNNST